MAWRSIEILLTGGRIVLEMQDQNWILNIREEGNVMGPAREVRMIGEGRDPIAMLHRVETLRRPQFSPLNVSEFVRGLLNEVTLYYNSGEENGVDVLGSDDQHYDTILGTEEANPPPEDTPTLLIPLAYNLSTYSITSGDAETIVQFNRMGEIIWQGNLGRFERHAPIAAYGQIRLPLSLQVQNDRISLSPLVENPLVTHRLLYFINGDRGWSEFSRPSESLIYFIWGDSTPYFKEDEGSPYINAVTGREVDALPPGPLQALILDGLPGEIVVHIRGPERLMKVATAYGFTEGGIIVELDSAEIGPSNNAIDIAIPTTGGHDLLNEIMRRIATHESLGDMVGGTIVNRRFVPPEGDIWPPSRRTQLSPQPGRRQLPTGMPGPRIGQTVNSGDVLTGNTSPGSRQVLDRLISNLYGLPVEQPDRIGDYQRTTLSEINQLMQTGQIANFEVNPAFQPFAVFPNRVLTFTTRDGRHLFTIAQYNFQTNVILP
jgi:hypothetical protein